MIKQNFHTHSIYDDGTDTIDEMVQTAIEKGFTKLGFSGHGFNRPIDDCSMTRENTQKYLADLQAAKEKYKGQIEIYTGIEQDSLSRLNRDDYEYVLGSVHFVQKDGKHYPVDYSREVFEKILKDVFNGDMKAFLQAYMDEVGRMLDYEEIDVVGHIDLISKYNEDQEFFSFDDPWYVQRMKELIDLGIEKGLIFEMNTGAISRGYRKSAYPHQILLEHMGANKAKVCINTDCHARASLDLGIEDCLQRAKEAGIGTLWTFENGRWTEKDIAEFAG
ncbi:MAG: histidinol-phosphatase HisJ family protein [Erysipelotrichaceae bacterium]|nr:histidinol-phosphatase HisJ family protein [Erysipelotrichaceae bacterium]